MPFRPTRSSTDWYGRRVIITFAFADPIPGKDSNSFDDAVLILTRRERFSGPRKSLSVVSEVIPVSASIWCTISLRTSASASKKIWRSGKTTPHPTDAANSLSPSKIFLLHIKTIAKSNAAAKNPSITSRTAPTRYPRSKPSKLIIPSKRQIQHAVTSHVFLSALPCSSEGASEGCGAASRLISQMIWLMQPVPRRICPLVPKVSAALWERRATSD